VRVSGAALRVADGTNDETNDEETRGAERFDTGHRPKQSMKRGAASAPLFFSAHRYFGATAPAAGQSVAPIRFNRMSKIR
jgi:hypothetical protein